MIGKLANLARKIRSRGDASKPIKRVNEALNEALEDAPVVPVPEATKPLPPIKPLHSFNRAAFYDHLRRAPISPRPTSSNSRVEGIDTMLDGLYGLPISWAAYALATAWHETGYAMKPNTETLNYSVNGLLRNFGRHRISEADAKRLGRKPGEPALSQARQREIGNLIYGGEWGRKNLGNTGPDDGWKYRGRGLEHVTGRRNYTATSIAIGVDLSSYPERLLEPVNAVRSLVTGMSHGRYTGQGFSRHLPANGKATQAQFAQARRIINGTDCAVTIAEIAMQFQAALKAGGW
jgi:putative chitinase